MGPLLFQDLGYKNYHNIKPFLNSSVQVGPLDFRPSGILILVCKTLLKILSWVIPETPLGRPDLTVITRDKTAQKILEMDNLRWTGGCKVLLTTS